MVRFSDLDLGRSVACSIGEVLPPALVATLLADLFFYLLFSDMDGVGVVVVHDVAFFVLVVTRRKNWEAKNTQNTSQKIVGFLWGCTFAPF